jgi:hypothetical protein
MDKDEQKKHQPADRRGSESPSTRVQEVRVRDDVWTRSAAQEFKDRPQFPQLRKK